LTESSRAAYSTSYENPDDVVRALDEANMNTYYVDAKTGSGEIGWATDADWPTPFDFDETGPVERATQAAHEADKAASARYAVFHDAHATHTAHPEAQIGDSDWIDPACEVSQTHEIQQLDDLLTQTAVDEVNLDFVRYPTTADASEDAKLPCTGGTLGDASDERTRVLADALAAITTEIRQHHPNVALSADVLGYTCYTPLTSIGQDVAQIAATVDWLMPMLYPSFFSPAESVNPYLIVRQASEACIDTLGDASLVKPWIQGFDTTTGPHANPASVGAQLQGARDADTR
jgi:hypothetical protein